ncbi:MAG: Hpt domain-containing protein, partial [Gammaproteobacteria bacterium]|nr:Hpt domain-containing protein [Gammaproteobacteria bacterium]
LDIYVRTGMERVEELAPQVELLKKIGDTLGVLGLGELREIVQMRRVDLEDLIGRNQQPDEAALVAMATALLQVEDRLEQQLIGLIVPDSRAAPADGEAREDPDRAAVTPVVMRECLANLARVKEAITLVTERAGDGAALDAIPNLLRGITAALLIVEKERAGRVAERIAVAAGEVVQRGGDDARAALERLADAIVSLEYYMETLQAGRRAPDWMLDNAARSLDALVLPAAVSPELETLPPPVPEDLPATLVIERDAVPESLPPPRMPSADRPVVTDQGAGIDPDILELFIEEAREAIESINSQFPAWEMDEGERESLLVMRRAFHTLKGSGRMVGAELIGDFCWSVEQLLNRIIDGTLQRSPPVVDLLRRAIPAVGELLEQLEVGQPPASDIAALMAEAGELARPAAAPVPEPPVGSDDATEVLPMVELDGALAPSTAPPVASVPAQAEAVDTDATLLARPPPVLGADEATLVVRLPDMLGPDDATLVARLPDGLPAAGLGPDDATLIATLPPVEPAAPAEATAAAPAEAPGMDPVLLDILSREVALHLGVLQDFTKRAGEAMAQPLPEAVFRACHTLQGSLTMAGVTEAVELAATLNDLMGVLYAAHLPADAEVIAASGEAAAAIAAIVDRLRDPSLPGTDTGGVTGWLHVLLAAATERAAALSAEPADTGTVSIQLPVLSEEDFQVAAADLEVAAPWSGEATVEEPPPAGEPAVSETPSATPTSHWDPEVAAIFAEEAGELLEGCDAAAGRLAAGEQPEQALAELQRALHTLKGGARMAGLFPMGDLSHELETLLLRISDGQLPRSDAAAAVVQATLDELHVLRDAISSGVSAEPSPGLLARP